MNTANFPLLSLILFTPLVGAALLLFVNRRHEYAIKMIANVFAIAGFVVSLPLWFNFNMTGPQFQFIEKTPWIPALGAQYYLGVDGFATHHVPLDQAPQAYADFREKKNGTVKVLLKP